MNIASKLAAAVVAVAVLAASDAPAGEPNGSKKCADDGQTCSVPN